MNPKNNIHILQFGTGNFLRGFFEPMIQELNENHKNLNICIIQSTSGKTLNKLKDQNYSYHLWEAGYSKGDKIEKIQKITCIKDGLRLPDESEKFLEFASQPQVKWIISNVTEAGMVWKKEEGIEKFAESFAGRLTLWLFRRFEKIPEAETIILPCELIPKNGDLLKSFVSDHAKNWNLPSSFLNWLDQKVLFLNNLVDRIVPGFPTQSPLPDNSKDDLLVQAEPYSFWAIEGNPNHSSILPWIGGSSEIVLQENIDDFSLRKIRILNGCHTFMAAKGLALGFKTVLDYVSDPDNLDELESLIQKEVIPFLPLEKESLLKYKDEVLDRFKNPFVEHKLEDIMLNSVSKFKSRLIPLIKPYQSQNNGNPPERIVSALIFLILYYLEFPQKIRDTQDVKDFFAVVEKIEGSQNKVQFAYENLFGLPWDQGVISTYEKTLKLWKKV